MYKKCVFFICAVFILEVKSDCDGYFDCFNSFFGSLFGNSDANIEYINATSKNLPENFVEVKDVRVSELEKVLSEISSFIQQDITDLLKTQSDSVLFSNVNPNTKVYVKTFSYNNPGNIILSSFKHSNEAEKHNNKEADTESSSSFTPTPQATKSDEIKIIENQKDVSENEISETDDIVSYYDSAEDNTTDYPIIDYVELYKDTTNEENVFVPTEVPTNADVQDEIQETMVEYVDGMEKFIWDINNGTDLSENVTGDPIFPWITTIFVKNDTRSNQFEYYCDGALLDGRLLITSARCVNLVNSTVEANDLLVILGKRSLLSIGDKEQILKVKKIITHENFTTADGKTENDLALLELEHPVSLTEAFQSATIGEGVEEVEKSFTTAWNLKGDIVPVSLEVTNSDACNSENRGENTFCAQYGRDVALCPSYGGIFAGNHGGNWRLYGIRSGDASDRGLCFDKHCHSRP